MKLKLRQDPLAIINNHKTLISFLVAFILFILLTVEVVSGNLEAWDNAILDWIRHFQHPILFWVARVSYFVGEAEVSVFVVIAGLAILAWKRYWQEAQVLGISAMGILLLIDKVLKPWFNITRPVPGLIDVHGRSYPSGHVSGNFMLYLYLSYLVAFYFPKWGLPCYIGSTILVIMMGWGSLYLYIHWVTDLLAGFCVGYMAFVLAVSLLKLMSKKHRTS